MSRPIKAVLSPNAVAHNLLIVKRYCGTSKIWAVVKANAYGHGLEEIYPGLQSADGLAMLDFSEAQRVRGLGWKGPILLLEGFFDAADIPLLIQFQLTPVIHCAAQIEMLEQAVQKGVLKPPASIPVYLKLNSGMNRLGFSVEDYRSAHDRLKRLGVVGEITLMSHFANADGESDGPGSMKDQLARINQTQTSLPPDLPCSLANSAAILDHPQTHKHWVRPGIMLYGATPFTDRSAASFGLRAAMRLQSEIIAVQTIKPGDSVGYGQQFVASKSMRIGIVACGYADGYPRMASNGTPILVDGYRTGTVGRVSMDMIIADLSEIPDARIGSVVELWGEQVSIDEVAQAAGTVGYELMCALSPRVPVVVDPR